MNWIVYKLLRCIYILSPTEYLVLGYCEAVLWIRSIFFSDLDPSGFGLHEDVRDRRPHEEVRDRRPPEDVRDRRPHKDIRGRRPHEDVRDQLLQDSNPTMTQVGNENGGI